MTTTSIPPTLYQASKPVVASIGRACLDDARSFHQGRLVRRWTTISGRRVRITVTCHEGALDTIRVSILHDHKGIAP